MKTEIEEIENELLRNIPAFSLHGTLKDFSTETVHTHSYHQVLMMRNGVSLLVTEKGKKPLHGSMCAFLPAGVAHRSVVIGSHVEYDSVYFRKELFSSSVDDIVIFELSGLAKELFLRINREAFADLSAGTEGKCFILFLDLLTEEITNTIQFFIPEPKSERCRKITNYIEENYTKKLRLSDFTSVLPYSEKHIARLFRREMTISVFEYLRLYRVFMASVILQKEKTGIVHIAYMCGYESLSNFYSDFKRYFPVAPGEYRKG